MLLTKIWCSPKQVEALKVLPGCKVLGRPPGKDYYIVTGLTLAQIEDALGNNNVGT